MPSGNPTKEEAFFTVLASAMLIDREERPDERAELEALVHRCKTLSSLNEEERQALFDRQIERIKFSLNNERTQDDEIRLACQTLRLEHEATNPGICLSAYIHAYDIAHADRRMVKSEEELLRKLAQADWLDVAGHATFQHIQAVMEAKNKY